MRKFYYLSTLLFWLAVLAFWGGNNLRRAATEEGSVAAADKIVSSAELARHDQPQDCWMAIRDDVYDVSAYLPEHPSRPEITLPWCGKEATAAYETKTKGRPHSAYADELLVRFRIGTLGKSP
jgi:cytochrome b involved in lipid metabolism